MVRLVLVALLLLGCRGRGESLIKVEGSPLITLPFTQAAPILRQQGLELKVSSESNSPRAIAMVATGQSDLALSTRLVLPAERAANPSQPLVENVIGYQVLAFIVSSDVWGSGVRSISREEMQGIYEGKTTNWKALGGPDRPIKFFNPEKGKGSWEFFVTWLYGDTQRTPIGLNFETVANSEETHNLVEFSGGAMSVISASRADEKGTFPLAVRLDDRTLVKPVGANVRNKTYPIIRPVTLVSAYRPSGPIKRVIDFMLSSRGQSFVRDADILPIKEEESE